jgi:ABC-type lipoprotein release transport system permease subunit
VTAEPMTADQFRWFLTLITGGVSVIWFLSDARKLIRTGREDGADPSVRDRRFGYTMGLVIATIGIVGSAKLNHWISFGGSTAAAPAAVTFQPVATQQLLRDFAGGDVLVLAKATPFPDMPSVVSAATQIDPDVVTADTSVMADCTLQHNGLTISGGVIKGFTPRRMKTVVTKYFTSGSIEPDSVKEPVMSIGSTLATILGVKLGDTIDVSVSTQAARAVRVTAIHDTGFGEYDLHLVMMNLGTAQALIGNASAAPTVELELGHADRAHHVARALQAKLGDAYKVIDWCELNQKFLGCTWQPSAD